MRAKMYEYQIILKYAVNGKVNKTEKKKHQNARENDKKSISSR